MEIAGNIIDIEGREIYQGVITVTDGKISSIERKETSSQNYILPGFVDAHIHIESSMVVPYEFAKVALTHGTVATISDPHEIANVMGVEGVHYMIENAATARLKFHFGAPSCVPATGFETAGATIGPEEVGKLLALDEISYLSEVMNYPGVLNADPEVMKKIKLAQEAGKPVDGHAPGLIGEQAKNYINAGISTDHECFTIEEALDKLSHGMKIIIREGSAAKNYEALHPLIKSHPENLMFCSDDKHPDDLLEGHINQLVKRSLKLGYDLFDVLRIACVHPVHHYKMNVGLLQEEDPADFIVVDSVEQFNVLATYIDGTQVADSSSVILPDTTHKVINNFGITAKKPEDFEIAGESDRVPCIQALDGELITEKVMVKLPLRNGLLTADSGSDVLKISVINRYHDAPVASAFIKNFGFTDGAIASTVAHDSHNIIVVGTTDIDMCRAANLLINNKGGLSAVTGHSEKVIALPVAGLMSDRSCQEIGTAYAEIDQFVKQMGCHLTAPYMTLSFMALLVIPSIKLSDLGLFDAESFSFISKV
ncbi:MAG: adenine deaminase [Cyclobacteriaceae bacterium]